MVDLLIRIHLLDILILFALVGGILISMRRAFLRTLISIGTLFLATIGAALLYNPLINSFTTSLGNPSSGRTAGAIVFFGLVVVFFAFFEYIVSRNYPDLRIRQLKDFDHVLGAVFGLILSALAISLLLLILEFGSQTIGGDVFWIEQVIRGSFMVPLFRAFFNLPLSLIRLLFPAGLPEILRFFST